MLFISILLSVWFVLWIAYAVFIKDIGKLFGLWMEIQDEEEHPELLLEKSSEIYHLNCSHCNYTWWSIEPHTNYCPNCGEKLK